MADPKKGTFFFSRFASVDELLIFHSKEHLSYKEKIVSLKT